MIINDLFKNDLSRRIKEVIKVDDPDLATVAEEIEDYWVTNHIEAQFAGVLDAYQETILSPSEEVNVWVSGFFGSGKSSFAKVLGYIVANPTLGTSSATELFVDQLPSDRVKALLNTIHDGAPTISVFVDLSSGSQVLKEGESVVLPLYRQLLSELGYSREPRLAELEFTLEGDGDLDEFERLFEEANDGKVWKERRHRALAANEASAAMHLLRPGVYNQPDSWARGSAQYPEITANSFAARALDLLERRRPDHKRVMFVVDEVGQYVATDVQRMLDLQGIAQAFQKQDGRLWLVVTSQEALEDIVSSLGGKKVELARVQDRFPLRVDLATSDIAEVVSHRVLAKTPNGKAAVRSIFEAHSNQLRTNTTLDSAALGREFTGDEFAQFYPLLPYQIELFIRAVSAHRARGGAGPMFGGTNRTLIRLAQQLVINKQTNLGEQQIGALATSAMAYDLLEGIIPDGWRFEVDQAGEHHGESSVESAVAKSVALLSDVPQVELKPRNLSVLLHPSVDSESLEGAVSVALGNLTSAETLRETDDGYRLQSPEEKDWEKRRRSIELNSGHFRRLVRERLSDVLSGVTASAAREFKLGLSFEDEQIAPGEIQVKLFEGGSDQLDRAVRLSRESAHESDLFVVFERSDSTWRFAEELHRSREMVSETEARARIGEETTLLHEERKRAERFERELDRTLRSDLVSGQVVFHGVEEPLSGSDARAALASAAAVRVDKIYPHLADWAAPIKRTVAVAMIKDDDLSGLPESLGPDGIGLIAVTADGHTVDRGSPALAALVAEVEKRKSYGQEASGSYLASHFAAAPYGGDVDVVMVVAAAGIRSGALEVVSDAARIRSHTDARLEKVFSALPKFRSAVFVPPKEGPNPEERARVARLLDEITGDRNPITTEQLAAAILTALGPERERLSRVSALMHGAGLEVPDSIEDARRILSRLGSESADERIASVDGGRSDIKDGITAGRRLDELVSDEDRFSLLRRAREIVSGPAHDLGDGGREWRQAIANILASREYIDEFADLRGAVEGISEERRKAWAAAVSGLDALVEQALEAALVATGHLEESEQEELLRPLKAFEPDEAWTYEAGPSTDRIQAMTARISHELDRIREQVSSVAGVEIAKVAVRTLYPKVVTSEDELESLLAAIRAAGEAALGDGKHFHLS